MTMKLTVDVYVMVPPGQYVAKLTIRKEMPATNHQYSNGKPRFAWQFEVQQGEFTGKAVSAWTETTLTSQNSLGKLIARMLGRPMRSGEEIDIDEFVGRMYSIIVEFNKNGKSVVTSAVPLPAGVAAAVTSASAPVAAAPTPAPASIPAPPPRPSAAPVPPPAAEKVFAGTREEFKDRSRWTYASISGGPGIEVQIAELRKMVEVGSVSSSDALVYLVADAAWMPLSVVDLPF